jgi:hypothetical protein
MICVFYLVKANIVSIKVASILGCWNFRVHVRFVVKVSIYGLLILVISSRPDFIISADFLALENLLSGESELDHERYGEHDQEIDHRRSRAPDSANAGNRFSRYLRFAKRRHRTGRGEEEPDPTDPYTTPETPVNQRRPSPSS